MKTRNKSNTERRNSVSDIADYFTTKAKMAGENAINSNCSKPTKGKEKETNKQNKRDGSKKDSWDEQVSDSELLAAEKTSNSENREMPSQQQGACHDNQSKDQSAIETSNSANTPVKSMVSQQTQTSEDMVLKELRELKDNYKKLDNDLNDPRNGVLYQLAKQTTRVDSLYSDIHGAVNGLDVRMTAVMEKATNNQDRTEKMEDNHKRLTFMMNENKKLLQDLQTMKGIVQKISQQAQSTSMQVLDLTKRGMEQNLIIHGVDNFIEVSDPKRETPMFKTKERCKHSALEFFKTEMNLDLSTEDIWKAHRIGAPKRDKVKPLVVKLSYPAKELIMENISSLKGRHNQKTGQVYFISEQIPEGIIEMRKQTNIRLKDINAVNDKRPKDQKKHIQVVNDNILIDGELSKPEISTPQPSDLFVDHKTQDIIDQMQEKFYETDPVNIKNSQFTALSIKVETLQEVQLAYTAVAQRYPAADHIVLAYALKDNGQLKHGGCDDREYGASSRMKKLIFEEKAKNVAVFVLRDFGGVHLGFERFKTIESITKDALALLPKV